MDFQTEKEAFFERLGDHGYMVLATSADDHPLACTMTCVLDGEAIYMQTDSNFLKVEQIRKNPQVALCSGSVQIEGTATLLGHPHSTECKVFADLFKLYYPSSFDKYATVESEIVIKVTPTFVTDWLYESGTNEQIHINFEAQTAETVLYMPGEKSPAQHVDRK